MNVCVYSTLLLYWVYHESEDGSSPYDRVAQCTLAIAALATALGFLAYGILTLRFYKSLDADYRNSVRAEQVVPCPSSLVSRPSMPPWHCLSVSHPLRLDGAW